MKSVSTCAIRTTYMVGRRTTERGVVQVELIRK